MQVFVPQRWQTDLLDLLRPSLSAPLRVSLCLQLEYIPQDCKPALDLFTSLLACYQEDKAQTFQCDPQSLGSHPASLSSQILPRGFSLLECF